eukprot:scaffold97935_cov25-Tisochrysis_lutea.AAC.1
MEGLHHAGGGIVNFRGSGGAREVGGCCVLHAVAAAVAAVAVVAAAAGAAAERRPLPWGCCEGRQHPPPWLVADTCCTPGLGNGTRNAGGLPAAAAVAACGTCWSWGAAMAAAGCSSAAAWGAWKAGMPDDGSCLHAAAAAAAAAHSLPHSCCLLPDGFGFSMRVLAHRGSAGAAVEVRDRSWACLA